MKRLPRPERGEWLKGLREGAQAACAWRRAPAWQGRAFGPIGLPKGVALAARDRVERAGPQGFQPEGALAAADRLLSGPGPDKPWRGGRQGNGGNGKNCAKPSLSNKFQLHRIAP